MIKITLFLLTLDSIFRITHPGHPNKEVINLLFYSEKEWFYLYKFNSLMFADSNTTALILLIMFFSVSSISKINKTYNYFYFKIFIITLILLTFSRSAYIALLIGYFSVNFKYIYSKKLFKNILFLLLFFSFYYVSNFILNDKSFNSKIYIVNLLIQKFKGLDIHDFIFGIGAGKAEYFLKISPHIFTITYLLETGILGLLLILYFFKVYSSSYSNTIILPVLIVGISYFLYLGAPFLFVPLAIVANVYDHSLR
ncbi:hypothetical protein [Aquirufa antheringensis]